MPGTQWALSKNVLNDNMMTGWFQMFLPHDERGLICLSSSSSTAPKLDWKTPDIVQQAQRAGLITTLFLNLKHPQMQPKADFSF